MTARPLRPATLRRAVTALAVLLLPACSSDGLLDVDAPDVVSPGGLESRTGAEALRAGALNRFAGAFANDFGQVMISGSLADEFRASHQLVLRTANLRATTGTGDDNGFFNNIQTTRLAAHDAASALLAHPPAGPTGDALARAQAAEMYALAAYAKLFLAETYCAGVPLSRTVDGRTEYGSPLTTQALLDSAIATFDSALTLAGDSTRILNAARVGKARALLGSGRPGDAAAAVAAVPTTFQYLVEYSLSNNRQANGIVGLINNLKHATVADREGGNGLPFVTAGDPRVQTTNLGVGFDGTTTVFAPSKYANAGSPALLASGIEARLVEAEAVIVANPAQWLAILNTLRATVPGLTPLADPGSPAARVDLHFREKAFWLFGTGQRLGDLRRLVRQYGRSAETVFPTGTYPSGGTYGTDVNIRIPEAERINPEFQGCLDRSA